MTDKLPAVTDKLFETPLLLRLAREIAIGQWTPEEILERFQITAQHWADIQKNATFQQMLEKSVAEWNSAENTKDRVALKAGAMLEDWLTEAHRRLHDGKEDLGKISALAQTIGRFANIGTISRDGGGAGDKAEKFSVVINIGGGEKVTLEKDITPKVTVIDAKPENAQ